MTVGPVPPSMFFGRDRELRTLVDYLGAGRSCAVIAGRRYGKTSVLLRLHGLRLPQLGFRTLYLDWQAFDSYDDVLAARALDWKPEPPPGTAATLGELLRNPPVDKRLVLLIDEVDRYIPADRKVGWRFFSQLRTLATNGSIRVVLSGERVLREALDDPNGPLFNLANAKLLGPLEYAAVEQLVVRPLKQLEIELVDQEEIVRRIYEFTSGHPNVIQRLCRRLVELIGEQYTRSITPAEVNAVINDPRSRKRTFWQPTGSVQPHWSGLSRC